MEKIPYALLVPWLLVWLRPTVLLVPTVLGA
jgi:hypothetical protein